VQSFTRFSAWFGNYSHGNKQHRLLAELSCAMSAGDTGATCSRSSVRQDYLPALRQVGGATCQWHRPLGPTRGKPGVREYRLLGLYEKQGVQVWEGPLRTT